MRVSLPGRVLAADVHTATVEPQSDVGAQTAEQAWLYNQIAANLSGLLIVAFAFGLWRALGTGWLARLGVLGLAVLGVTRFLEGFLMLSSDGLNASGWERSPSRRPATNVTDARSPQIAVARSGTDEVSQTAHSR